MRLPKFSAVLISLTLAAAVFSNATGAQSIPISPAHDLDAASTIFAFGWPAVRDGAPSAPGTSPADMSAFLPAGRNLGPGEALKGQLTLPETALSVNWVGAGPVEEIILPETRFSIITHGDRLVPLIEAEATVIDRRRKVLLFGVGRVWREASDGGQSRALLPVALIDGRTGGVRNGLALFRYGDRKPIGPVAFQFSQETAPGREADAWGAVKASFEPGAVPGAETRLAAYEARQATAPVYRDWSALETDDPMEEFDGPPGRLGAVSVSGLIVDRTIYLTRCSTRHGPYPFCRQMRHGIHSLSSPLLALPAAAHLIHRFGTPYLTAPMRDLVPEFNPHPQWRRVRVFDLLNMTSGLGEAVPSRTMDYVAADQDAAALAIRAAGTKEEKLAVALHFPSYPWAPGEVFRFRLADGFGLALALDRIARDRLGKDRALRDVLQERLFKALNIPRAHMRVSVGSNASERLPDISEGFFPTTGEMVRLILLMRSSQFGTKRTVLDHDLIGEALDNERERGQLTGLRQPAGAGRYHLGFWRFPARLDETCSTFVVAGRGWGGSVVQFLPRGMTAFRIADGNPAVPETRDTTDLRRVAHKVRPFCGP